jgi:peptidoglycan/xylan/chitin deacetylase (PgdA/CDA1 family)
MKKFLLFCLVVSFTLVSCSDRNNQVIVQRKSNADLAIQYNINEKENHSEETQQVIDEEKVKFEPLYYLQSDHTVTPIKSNTPEKVVLLTIDDTPNRYALEMAKILKKEGINAIFFVNGHFINEKAGQEKIKEIYDLGFEIGNHTMTHQNLKSLHEKEQKEEIIKLNDLIEEITGERPRFFRAPYGANTDVSRNVVSDEKMQWMNWSYGYDFDKDYMEKEALTKIMVNTELLKPGANLLLHDHKWTLEALPGIIDGLRQKGYGFVDPKTIR